jgi:ribose transport system substrate-binding protein
MKRTQKYMMLVLLLAVVVALAGACAPKQKKEVAKPGETAAPAAAPATAAKKIIGVSLLKENDDFYITLKKGLEETAAAMGYDIVILSADNDELKQDKDMDTLLLKNVSAIVICPVNSMGVGAIIQKATAKNIPVFTADIAAKTGKVVAHIASDNYMGGQLAAERMSKLIGGSGKVAVVQQPGTESVMARVGGFVDTGKKSGLTIVEPFLNGKDDTQESERAANAAILKTPGLKGIFAANDNMAMGAKAAITASGKNIVLIGYDAAPAAQQTIKAGGPWKADVIQYPYEIGKITLQTIDKFLKGEIRAEEKTIIVPVKVGLVDATNIK